MRGTRSKKTAPDYSEYMDVRNMVMFFRVSELQALLGHAQYNRSGRKSELQSRALTLIDHQFNEIRDKVRQIYHQQQTSLQTPISASARTPSPVSHDIELSVSNSTTSATGPITRSAMYQQPMPVPTEARNHSNGVVLPQFSSPNGFPIHPDVKLKKLAFFDVLGTLLKPSTLVPGSTQRLQEATFCFSLTPQQATDIATNRDIRNGSKVEHTIQVQLRFCLLETTCEQDDNFPPNVAVKVNTKMVQLPNPIPTNKPGVEPKRPPRPVNVTTHVKLSPASPNYIHVTWCTEYARVYALSAYLVRKLTSVQLLQRLKIKGVKPADYTRALIKEKLNEDADCEIATTMLRVSLVCPLGKMRMTTPCRSSTCSHLQCFDASLYLQMNERKPTWNCPVCDKSAQYENLVIDGYFQEVLASAHLSSEDSEIQLHKDGSWSTHVKRSESQILDTPHKGTKSEQNVEVISDDLEVITTDLPKSASDLKSCHQSSNNNNEPTSTTNESVVDLTLSDSDDDVPIKKRQAVKTNANNNATNTAASATNNSSNTNVAKSNITEHTSVIMLDSPSPPSTPEHDPKLMAASPNDPSGHFLTSSGISVTSTTLPSSLPGSLMNPLNLNVSQQDLSSNYYVNPMALRRYEQQNENNPYTDSQSIPLNHQGSTNTSATNTTGLHSTVNLMRSFYETGDDAEGS